jgi:hypothetical protein
MKKKKNISKISIIEKAEEALKKAVQETIADHKRTGDPIAIWRDGKAVFVDPEELEVREPKEKYRISGKRKR